MIESQKPSISPETLFEPKTAGNKVNILYEQKDVLKEEPRIIQATIPTNKVNFGLEQKQALQTISFV